MSLDDYNNTYKLAKALITSFHKEELRWILTVIY
jgi:hypothetical protein